MRTFRTFVAALSALLAFPPSSLSQGWSLDPALNTPVCDADGAQSFPLVVSDGAFGTIIVWDDFRNGIYAIYAQRIIDRGYEDWTHNGVLVFQAPIAQSSTSFQKDALPDGNGGAFITWSAQLSGSTTGRDIFMQHIAEDGSPAWSSNGIPVCNAKGDQTDPRIATDGAGGGIITWTDSRLHLFSPDIFAQKVSGSGSPQWTANGIPIDTTNSGSQGLPMIVADGAGGAVIAWADARHLTYFDVYAQKVDANGSWQWGSSSISASTLTENKFLTGLTTDGKGGAILCWQQSQSSYQLTVAQRINAAGSVLWGGTDGVLVYNNLFRTYGPRLVSDGAGGAIFAWRDTRDSLNTGNDIFAQRLDSTGAQVWDQAGVPICQALGDQVSLAIAASGNGAALTWQDHRNGADNYDIFAQLINLDGSTVLPAGGVAICTNDADQQRPTIITNGLGWPVIAWEDARNVAGNLDIYTQIVYRASEETQATAATNTPYTFTGLVANFSNLGTVNSLTVHSFIGQYPPGLPKALSRFFDISSDGTGFSVTITFSYTHQEILGAGLINGDANLVVYSNDGAGWAPVGGVTDTAANTVTVSNVSAFSLWALQDPQDTTRTSVRSADGEIFTFHLQQNYPNPFNPVTTIEYSIQADGWRSPRNVRLELYDILGRRVKMLVDEAKMPGTYRVVLDAQGLTSGVYFYRLTSGATSLIKKLLLLR